MFAKNAYLLFLASFPLFAAAAPTTPASHVLQRRDEHCWDDKPNYNCRVEDAKICIDELAAKGDLACSAHYGRESIFCKHQSCQIFGQSGSTDPNYVARSPCKDVARGIAKVFDWCYNDNKDGWIHGWNYAWGNGNLFVGLRTTNL